MAGKYQKPIARSLGEAIPISDGICGAGSNVYTQSNSTCNNGTGASNQNNGCRPGIGAGGAGCNAGTNPNPAVSCTNGYIAY